jgi:diguanylate cyclase
VIRAAAQIIRANIKGRDVAARIGGEEFAIFLPETSVRGATALAEQIRTTMAGCRIRRSGLDQPIGQVTLSVGIAEASESDTLEGLLDRADRALYEAKRNGRNRVWVDSTSTSA